MPPADIRSQLPIEDPQPASTDPGSQTQTRPGPDRRSPSLEPAFRPGEVIGDRFTIIGLVGRGGMGEVYEADDLRLEERVALKTIRGDSLRDPTVLERFRREVQLARKVTHINVCRLFDFEPHVTASGEEIPFLSMELLRGETLAEHLRRKSKLTAAEALPLVIQIAAGLSAAHRAGIVHRDFKSANVILVAAGGGVRAVVTDFGLARTTDAGGVAAGAEFSGTPAYMAPEQLAGGETTAASDVFAFGLVIYEMLMGTLPFGGGTTPSAVAATRAASPYPLSRASLDLDPRWDAVIRKCLDPDPARRFSTAEDVARALEPPVEAATPLSWRRLAAWLAVPLLGLAAAARFQAERPSPQSEAALEYVPLTSYNGIESTPAISPDGTRVAFSWNGEDRSNYDVYMLRVGEDSPVRLTSHEALEECPAWSPDGRRLAFLRGSARYRQDVLNGAFALHVMAAEGGADSHVIELTAAIPSGQCPGLAWTPDGGSLVVPLVGQGSEPSGLFAVSVETTKRQRLTTFPRASWDMYPTFSPDGRWLAFVRALSPVGHVWVMPAAGGVPRRVTEEGIWGGGLAWAPDSRSIIAGSGRHGPQRLSRLRISADAPPEPILSAEDDLRYPSIAAGRLVFATRTADVNVWSVAVTPAGGPASAATPVLASTREDADPSYSPDGRRIAFVSKRLGRSEVWVADADGTNAVQITSLNGFAWLPHWSSDGGRITFGARVENNEDIYAIDLATRSVRRLTDQPAGDEGPCWSTQGDWIYFSSDRTGRHEVFRVRADGGDAIQVTDSGGFMPRPSPDGRWLYYLPRPRRYGDFRRLPLLNGIPVGEPEVIQGAPVPLLWMSWAPGLDGLFIAARSRDSESRQTTIYYFDVRTRRTTAVHSVPLQAFGIRTLTAAGRLVAWAQVDRHDGDLRMVEGFR